MEIFLHCFSFIALAEIGDKTQLLAICLAARFRRLWPVTLGILAATLLNHAVTAYAGHFLAELARANWVPAATALLMIAIGLWTLVPDKEPAEKCESAKGAFIGSATAFFLAEMGDKTQLATLTLGAEYEATLLVILGTTAGMLAANLPAVLLGERILRIVPLKPARTLASLLFIGTGLWQLYAALQA